MIGKRVFFVRAIIVWFDLVCIAYCLLSTIFAWWMKILISFEVVHKNSQRWSWRDIGWQVRIWILFNGNHELQHVQPHILVRCARTAGDLYNLSVISGLCIGPKLTAASALCSTLSSPKVTLKVKIKTRAQNKHLSKSLFAICRLFYVTTCML